jgi:indolepyruvate ferredoxin oxidoreductase beta subunit
MSGFGDYKRGSLMNNQPLNLLLAGVGGQGNIMISSLIGTPLIAKGYTITVGETYGASQRGGGVTSHIRISRGGRYSPLIPYGKADVILGLEPMEVLRALGRYGNPGTVVVTNTRPIYPIGVLAGEADYPDPVQMKDLISQLSCKVWFVNASDIALKLGLAVITNIVMVGALVGAEVTPLTRELFEKQLAESMSPQRLKINLKAFSQGFDAIKQPAC